MIVTLANTQALGRNLIRYSSSTLPNNKAAVDNSLQELLKESQSVLFRFHTVFPFDLFPDEITIDENKVNIVRKSFFFTYNVHSILISDITDVLVDTGPLFASLRIIDSSNYRFPIVIKISFLSKRNAFEARKLIQGLISTKRKNISLGTMPLSKVIEEVSMVGETRGKDIRGA
jgi:hypothetical protein